MFNRLVQIGLFLLMLVAAKPLLLYTQVTEEWRRIYTGPGVDALFSMCIDGYGDVYVTGNSRNSINSSDYATVKYSTTGVQQWAARYGGVPSLGAIAYSIASDKYGNAYVTGSAPLGINQRSKYTTIKYSQLGAQTWLQIYYGVGQWDQYSNIAYCIAVDDDANVYVTGLSYFGITGADYATIKYDSSGTQQWVASYTGPGSGIQKEDAALRVAVDNSGNIYVTGYSMGDTTYNDIATVKYDSNGVQQWAARYNGLANGGDSAIDLKVDNSGNVYVCGTSYSSPLDKYDYITIKYNSSGVQQWVSRYSGGGNLTDYATSLAVDDSANVYVTGYSITASNGLDCVTIKYNSSGTQQWLKVYDFDGGPDWGKSIALDDSGNVYVLANSTEGIRQHFATIKYSPLGVQQWVIRTYSQDGESPVALAVDSLKNVYVAGSDGNYLTIKYNQIIGINPVSNEIPEDFALMQNYPNPFNPNSKIKFQIPKASYTRLTIFDAIGRKIETVVSQQLNPGIYEVDFDGNKLSSGVYFYRLEAGTFTDTKKMVLIK